MQTFTSYEEAHREAARMEEHVIAVKVIDCETGEKCWALRHEPEREDVYLKELRPLAPACEPFPRRG